MKKKVYFVLGGFPIVSQSFLYNQITEVIKEDQYEVQILVLNKKKEKVHSAYERLNEKIIYFSSGRGTGLISRISLTLNSFFYLLVKNPSVLLQSLNVFKYSRTALNGNYLILARQFLGVDPNLFHCHFGTTAKIVADLKNIGAVKAKMISSFHGIDITVYPKKYGNKFYERLFRVSEMFTGNSKFIINKMIATGCPVDKIVKIPMCLNTSQFQYRGKAPARDIFKILTVGRFVEKKGYEFSLRALALLKESGISFIYNVIGEGILKEKMIRLAEELGIKDQVVFHGAMMQEKVKEFYRNSHVFLLASVTAENGDTEGQGLVLQEAQAIGLPVVATLHNGFPDSIIDGKTGFLVPEKDYKALADKLLLLAYNEDLCNEMGKLGRSFVEDNFDAKIIGQELTTVYESILA